MRICQQGEGWGGVRGWGELGVVESKVLENVAGLRGIEQEEPHQVSEVKELEEKRTKATLSARMSDSELLRHHSVGLFCFAYPSSSIVGSALSWPACAACAVSVAAVCGVGPCSCSFSSLFRWGDVFDFR